MTNKTDRRPKYAAYKRQHKNDVEDERGWAGQHGQAPSNAEEDEYRPQKESSQKAGRWNEDER